MQKHLLSSLIAVVLAGVTASAALANYKGPHPVMQYHGNEYAVVITPADPGKTLVVYRAVGSMWQRVGGTTISPGQNSSNGSLAQNVWFKGHKIYTFSGDLRLPFYRLYNNQGAIDY